MTTVERFRDFASAAAAGGSPIYAELAAMIAADESLGALVDRARDSQRQPVLVLAVCRLLGAPLSPPTAFRGWMLGHADAFLAELDGRLTQTNDVRRSGPIAIALARAGIDAPVALIEVGASAGLGLYLDRFSFRVERLGDPEPAVVLGDPDSPVCVTTTVDNTLLDPGAALPTIAHRRGIDLAPLDLSEPRDVAWLETLLWPGQDDRLALLRAAVAIAVPDRGMPHTPLVVAGDAVDALPRVLASLPSSVVPVVVSTGTLVYLPGARRQRFVDLIAQSGARWISYERTGLLSGVHATIADSAPRPLGFATLALDGTALATGDAHGTALVVL